MIAISNNSHWIEEKLLQVNLVDTMAQPNGFSRLGFTQEEKAAHKQFRLIAKSLGLQTHQDDAGNQWAIWEVDPSAGTIAAGSHLDTVYSGGGYDGTAGVIAAFAAVKMLKEQQFQPAKNIAIIAFSCEESARFGTATIGSQAICGLLDTKRIAKLKDSNGITLKEAVEHSGLNWQKFQNAEIPQNKIEQFIELHIEQGTTLENKQKDIGIVRAIAQATRLRITCTGMTNHTGTTPMHERRDALVSTARLISFVEETASQINQRQTTPLMATVSTIENSPNAMNMIPGTVTIGVDIRSTDAKLKQEVVQAIEKFISNKKKVSFHIETLADADPVQLDAHIQETLKKLCQTLNLSSLTMDSGAGHDAMNMATRWPSGLLFIPCRLGISHHPAEYTEIQSIIKGAKLLSAYFKEVHQDTTKYLNSTIQHTN